MDKDNIDVVHVMWPIEGPKLTREWGIEMIFYNYSTVLFISVYVHGLCMI